MNQELRLKNIDEIRYYSIQEINQNELINKKHKNVCRIWNYISHLLIAIPIITGCFYISAFASLVGNPIGITSSAVGLKICVITEGIKKHNSINKKNKNKHDRIISLAKSEWNRTGVLISKALIDSNISHGEFVLINNLMKEFYDMKEEMKNPNNKQKFTSYINNAVIILSSKYVVCDSKNLKFIKEQETSGLLSSLWINTPLNKAPLICPLLFQEYSTNYYKIWTEWNGKQVFITRR